MNHLIHLILLVAKVEMKQKSRKFQNYKIHLTQVTKLKTNINRSKFMKNLNQYCFQYCQNTSLHGLKFLGEKGRNIFERLFWLATIIVFLCFCTNLILKVYRKWEESPVIVTFAAKQTPVWEIPFPAVTICPEIKIQPSLFNYSEMYRKEQNAELSEFEKDLYEYMPLLCNSSKKYGDYKFVNEELLDFMAKVAPKFIDNFLNCRWMETWPNNIDVFVPVITDAGICYTFNILDRTEMFTDDVYHYKWFHSTNKSQGWSLETGFLKILNYSYPRRAFSSGAKAGLTINLHSSKAPTDYCCTGGFQGFKVHVHHPADIPRVEENYFRLSLDEVINAAIKPNMMITNSKLYDYKPQDRQCFLPEDKVLRFFRLYSQQNCQVECLTNFTLKSCNCVAFHMPRVPSTPICGASQKHCLLLAEAKFLSNEVNLKVKPDGSTEELDELPNQICNCLPSCFSTTYNVEISQTKVNWENCNHTSQTDGYHFKLILYFKERQFLSSERNELYGQTDFLANCGGLLGLFIGFSFISVVELFYFLTLRLLCNCRKFGKHHWAGKQEHSNYIE